jgi:hypothetical protein
VSPWLAASRLVVCLPAPAGSLLVHSAFYELARTSVFVARTPAVQSFETIMLGVAAIGPGSPPIGA